MATTITKAPSPKPRNLVITRGNDATDNGVLHGVINASWGNPNDATSDTNHRWEDVEEAWYFNASNSMSKSWVRQQGNGHAYGDWLWAYNKGIHDTSTVWYRRASYHPIKKGRYLTSIDADVYACNSVAGWKSSAHAYGTFTFRTPKKPTISVSELDDETGHVTWTIETDEGKNQFERYDTMWCVTRQDSKNMGTAYAKEKIVKAWASTRSTSQEYERDVTAVGVKPGQWVRYTVKAYARGLAGDSKEVSASFTWAYPAVANITSITATSVGAVGVITVAINTKSTKDAPVDTVTLQRLHNVTYSTASTASTASGWTDVMSDDAQCKGLSDLVPDAIPDVKKHTWYRLVTTHAGLTRYSAPKEATCLYREKDALANDYIAFKSLTIGDDNQSLVARLAWDPTSSSSTYDGNACEIAWSTHEDAWESTEQPSSFIVMWEDATPYTGYAGSCTVTVRGLEERTPYYVRARRVLVTDGSIESSGPWKTPSKSKYPITTMGEAVDVYLEAPTTVPVGGTVELAWTHDGEKQRAWCVYRLKDNVGSYTQTTDTTVVDGKNYYTRSGSGTSGSPYVYTVYPATDADLWSMTLYECARKRVVVASDTVQRADNVRDVVWLPWSTFSGLGVDSVDLMVSITCGGDWADSQIRTVRFADPPTFAAAVSTLTYQPVSIGLTADMAELQVAVSIEARGVSGDDEIGRPDQAEGDVIWTWGGDPDWVASDELWATTVTAPSDLDLRDGAWYDVVVRCTNRVTGLSSEATVPFQVNWSHQATCPGEGSYVRADSEDMTALICAEAPSDAEQTDVCDIYRVTPDGSYLIGEDIAFGTEVTDQYAPYGRRDAYLRYRLCTRTVDGDVDWMDVEYELRGTFLRLDWDGGHVELPYNVTTSDAWTKGFEARTHLDGSVSGYWDANVQRTASLSTDLMAIDGETAELVREMATHSGPCFVRTPDGCAFEANVDVSGLERAYGSSSIAVSITATEVAMTDEYRIPPEE